MLKNVSFESIIFAQPFLQGKLDSGLTRTFRGVKNSLAIPVPPFRGSHPFESHIERFPAAGSSLPLGCWDHPSFGQRGRSNGDFATDGQVPPWIIIQSALSILRLVDNYDPVTNCPCVSPAISRSHFFAPSSKRPSSLLHRPRVWIIPVS